MNHAIKLAIVEDKPIMMDYWTASLDKSVVKELRQAYISQMANRPR